MRFYDLKLTNPQTGKTVREWSSRPGGVYDPHALNVIFDIPVTVGGSPIHQPIIIVEGVAIADIGNAQQFAGTIDQDTGAIIGGTNLTLTAGMQAGLPLANPRQAGLLAQGTIFQSWGNWIGTDMSLAFIVVPSIYRYDKPGNIVFNWQKGQTLQQSLQQTFSVAYPNIPVTYRISGELVATKNDLHYCPTFDTLAQHVVELTGVNIAFRAGTIVVFDKTNPLVTTTLSFFDFVGQPTWVAFDTIQVKTVLRGDIQVGDYIEFPKGFYSLPSFVTTQSAAFPSYAKYQSAIQGIFAVNQVRHVGNFRQSDGNDWVSIFNCVVVGS